MRHRRGLGRFGRWMEEGAGFGPRGMAAGRKLGSGELQLLILALLEEQLRHGYDLIKELTERSGGFYVPSPGIVYPALTYLEEFGHTAVESEGAKKLYRITESGKAELEKNREMARDILGQFERIARTMERMRRFIAGETVEEDVDDRAEFRAGHAMPCAKRRAQRTAPRPRRSSACSTSSSA